MKPMNFKRQSMALAWVMTTGLLAVSSNAGWAQTCNATGTCGNVSAPTMSGTFIVPLANQEREPMLVGPQGPAGVQGPQGLQGAPGPSALENSFYVFAENINAPYTTAVAFCGASRVLSGGGVCNNVNDFSASMVHSTAVSNGWSIGCTSSSGNLVQAQAYALCSPN